MRGTGNAEGSVANAEGANAEAPAVNAEGPRRERRGPSAKNVRTDRVLGSGSRRGQAAELPVLDEDVEEADDEEVDAAGLASDVEDDADVDDDGVEDFDAAGELLDDEPRLSFR